ncbi:MAG TPA: hypothetical protein PK957_04710 [Candidatus Dojkabacteria bacterium]|nr:hypothetical protein [Candidatus Dojkabacteria bacterium]HQF36258.1 hypothetical protein [Candidatus Dojkabacteria bacterium]
MKKFLFIPVLLIVIGIPIILILLNKDKANKNENNGDQQNIESNINENGGFESKDPDGTIYVEAGEGTLFAPQYSRSYIEESARGLEAYLAEKGASAVYDVAVDVEGKYVLWVKLSDDALHDNYERNVAIVINNNQTLQYNNIAEDTKGWK